MAGKFQSEVEDCRNEWRTDASSTLAAQRTWVVVVRVRCWAVNALCWTCPYLDCCCGQGLGLARVAACSHSWEPWDKITTLVFVFVFVQSMQHAPVAVKDCLSSVFVLDTCHSQLRMCLGTACCTCILVWSLHALGCHAPAACVSPSASA